MWKLTRWFNDWFSLLLNKKSFRVELVTLIMLTELAIADSLKPFSQLTHSPLLNSHKPRQLFLIAGSSTVGEVLAPNLAKR